MAELLLKKGYIVHGLKRRSSSFNTQRLESIYQDPHESSTNFYLHHGDLTDSLNVLNLINKIKPDEIYNLAAMSHVHVSFEMPEYVANVDAIGTQDFRVCKNFDWKIRQKYIMLQLQNYMKS